MSRYVVAQTPVSGAWTHYLCAWHGADRDLPGWDSERSRALVFDAEAARELVVRFDAHYRCPASGMRHHVEELPA